MILNLTLRVICCVKPREVPIIIFCTLSTTNTTNAHDDFASRKSERESMTFLATICGQQANAECVTVKRESGAHLGDLFPEAPRSTLPRVRFGSILVTVLRVKRKRGDEEGASKLPAYM